MTIPIITTGGTFDKTYNPINGELEIVTTSIPSILKNANVYGFKCDVIELMRIDSLYMTQEHRWQIAAKCREITEQQIVIVHGTDTMVETAQVLGKQNLNKVIVLVGAMKSVELKSTDAPTNLIGALSASSLLPKGVYIAMGGATYPYNNVFKDTELGQFKPVNKQQWLEWMTKIK